MAKGRSFQAGLYMAALVGPVLFLAGLLTRGLGMLQAELPRLVLMYVLMALSAGAAGYLVLRSADARFRLAAAVTLVINLAIVLASGLRWMQDTSRAEAQALLQPIPAERAGIVVAPRDQSAEAAREAEAIEAGIRRIFERNGLGGALELRRAYAIPSTEFAQRLGLTLGANVVVWQSVEGGRTQRVVHTVTVLGAHDMEAELNETDLLLLMATQEQFSVYTPYEDPEAGLRVASDVVAPVAASFGALSIGSPVVAATHFRNALQSPDLQQSSVALLRAYRALALLHAGRPDLAVPEYEQSIALDPTACAWGGLGNARLMARDWGGARTAYQRAIALDSYSALPYCGLGVILARERDVSGAISAYRQAVALEPDWAAPHAFLGLAHELRGDATSAQQEFQVAVARSGPNATLQEAAARRAEQVIANPPTAIPTATPRPTPTATPFPSSGVYQVQRDDTLAAIAEEFGVSTEVLIEVNRLENPNALSIGQILIIPELP